MTTQERWIETPLYRPGTQIVLLAGGLFALVGFGLLGFWWSQLGEVPDDVDLLSSAGMQRHGHVVVVAVLGFLFAGAGTLALAAGLRLTFRNEVVRHVPDDAVPEVPPRPLLPIDADTSSLTPHVITGDRLEPDPRVLGGKRAFVVAFTALFGAFFVWLLIMVRPLGPGLASNLALGVLAAVMFVTAVVIIFWVIRQQARSLVTFDFGGKRWRVTQAGDELAAGDRDQLVAVQIAAARHRVGTQNRTTITDALELNLAWRCDDGGEVQRVNLVRSSGSFPRVVELGSRLAERLDLPLLYHGTADHWDDEKRRTRRRRPGRGGIYT